MAQFTYFSDLDGITVQLKCVIPMPNAEFRARWPGVKGVRYDGFQMKTGRPVGGSDYLPLTRSIEMKANPSKHECNAKCLNGAHNGRCECKCNGRNHGRGLFTKLLSA
jgi:hypothetical protein